ncbi:polysaccharide deacetylase family protein [Flavobacterium cyclinae]|uniref:polysaccharide deacetylase family protein n=1 Tax=Flavobacterium cyclinae TaxID=2895947 RepID=UPI001E586697|nr:polysaccharide deacetylase family protein [Flavobacterium cyclinae]UGS21409.1 polysaccharide deacetylase family protein [Flavobacterium cyclinae]
MNFKWVKTNKVIKKIFNNLVWDIPNSENKIYLTFDDGPIPSVTEWVLDVLKSENIKATFFCIGDNIKKYPEIYKRILTEGHQIGNHTFNHLNGWKTKTNYYIENFKLCETEHSKLNPKHSFLFRPPYGKIKPSQSKEIRQLGYKIIMWDVLSYDFDQNISEEECLKNVISNTSQGSIIVFHDSLKAEKNLKYGLPKAIQILKNKGFTFDVIK